jgi:hypothetical protein
MLYLGVELARELQAVAFIHPGGHLAAVQAEGNGAVQRVGRVLAEEVVRSRVGHFNRTVGHAVQHAKSGHQFASGVRGDLELAARHVADLLGEHIANAEEGVQ